MKGLGVRRVLEAIANERIGVSNRPVQIERAGAAFEELNDVFLDVAGESLGGRDQINAMWVFGARFPTPFGTVQTPHVVHPA